MSTGREDAELVRRALAGGQEAEGAFQALVNKYLGLVRAYVWHKIGDAEAARDIAQDALSEACRAIGDLRNPEKFGAWAIGIAQRKCIYWIRGQQRSRALLEAAGLEALRAERARLSTGDLARVQELEREEARQAVRRAIMDIPEKYRAVIVLKHFDNRSYEEIASILSLSEAAVDKRLTRARMMLRKLLRGFKP